jgi:hypothetical protein
VARGAPELRLLREFAASSEVATCKVHIGSASGGRAWLAGWTEGPAGIGTAGTPERNCDCARLGLPGHRFVTSIARSEFCSTAKAGR